MSKFDSLLLIVISELICNLCLGRAFLAALHYNENAGRPQAVTKAGELRHDLRFPKYKQGGFVVRKVLAEASYGNELNLLSHPFLFQWFPQN